MIELSKPVFIYVKQVLCSSFALKCQQFVAFAVFELAKLHAQ